MSIFRISKFINTPDLNRALPSRPGHTPADKMRVAMHTQGQAPLPIKEGRAKGGVTCPKCGHSHAAGSTCAYMKGLSDWLDKANTTKNRGHYTDDPDHKRDDGGKFAPKGGSGGGAKASAPRGKDEETKVMSEAPELPTEGSNLNVGPSVSENSQQFWKEAQEEWGGGPSSVQPRTQSRPGAVRNEQSATANHDPMAYDQTQVAGVHPSQALVPYNPQQQAMTPQGPIIDAEFEDAGPQYNPQMLPGSVSQNQPMSSLPPHQYGLPAGSSTGQLAGAQPQQQLGSGYNPMQTSSNQGAAASSEPSSSGDPNNNTNKPNKPQSTPTPSRSGGLDIAGMLPGNARAIGAGLGSAGGSFGATASAAAHPFGALSQEAHGLLKPQKPGAPKDNSNNMSNTMRAQSEENNHADTMARHGQRTRKPMPQPRVAPGIR